MNKKIANYYFDNGVKWLTDENSLDLFCFSLVFLLKEKNDGILWCHIFGGYGHLFVYDPN